MLFENNNISLKKIYYIFINFILILLYYTSIILGFIFFLRFRHIKISFLFFWFRYSFSSYSSKNEYSNLITFSSFFSFLIIIMHFHLLLLFIQLFVVILIIIQLLLQMNHHHLPIFKFLVIRLILLHSLVRIVCLCDFPIFYFFL